MHIGGWLYRRAVLLRLAKVAAKTKGELLPKAYGAVPSKIVVEAHKQFQSGNVQQSRKMLARECMEVIWESCRGNSKRPLPDQ